MKIGIIGTGAIGSILIEKLSAAGHQVKITNTRAMPELEKIATSLGATAASLQDVVKEVDIIIFSMPFNAYKDLPKDLLQDVPSDVIIMDTANYYPPRDGELPGLEDKTESEYISMTLGRPIIKVFNNIMEYTLKHNGKPSGEKERIAISVAGDNEEHKKIAAELVDLIGFDSVDGGSLDESWRQQPGTPSYCTELNAAELKQALLDAEREKSPDRRDLIMDKLLSYDTFPPYQEVLAINRSVQLKKEQ